MSKATKMKEITTQSVVELTKALAESAKELNSLRLRTAQQDLKDVRAIRALRITRARLATRLHQLNNQSLV